MNTLVYKLTLAPAFVVGASLAARHYGHKVGGLAAGLPVVAGPLLFILSLEQGLPFAARAAAGSLWGLVSLAAYVVAYVRVAEHRSWPWAMAAGYAAFGLVTWAFRNLHTPLWIALLGALASFHLGRWALPKLPEPEAPPLPDRYDLPIRALAAALLVLVLTGLATALGPALSGLLTTFPVVTTVLAVFSHRAAGAGAAERLMKALLWGLHGYSAFLMVISLTLEGLGLPASFGLGLVSALIVQGSVYTWLHRNDL